MVRFCPLTRRGKRDSLRRPDVIRIYQSKVLADKYSMYELTVMRPKERTSKSFEDQVLARRVLFSLSLLSLLSYLMLSAHHMLILYSPDYHSKDTLILVIHDPYVKVLS